MQIPKQFQILNRRYSVEVYAPTSADDDTRGETDSDLGKIYLNTSLYADRVYLEQIFLHELTHAILDGMGESRLSSNEKFVGLFSAILHQCFLSYAGTFEDEYNYDSQTKESAGWADPYDYIKPPGTGL